MYVPNINKNNEINDKIEKIMKNNEASKINEKIMKIMKIMNT